MKRTTAWFAVLVLASCTGTKIRTDSPVGVKGKVYDDVPVFRNMSWANRSHEMPDGSLRVFKAELRGRQNLANVIAFYRKVLRDPHGWELVREDGAPPNPTTLEFVKGKERLKIVGKVVSIHETLLTFEMGPR